MAVSKNNEVMEIDFAKIEKKWQKKWDEAKLFEVKEDPKKKKFYVLEMFPYPSGSGLHMGHAWNYSIGDVFARYKKMQGFNVLHPMGFDSFGLPAENAAIKDKSHPKKYTETAIKNFTKQFKELGISYDWTRMVETHKPDYYTWDQWIFLKMYEKGLAYKKKSPVNWCPKCNTVLANEQVQGGKCWRHEDTNVEIKNLEQWFFKTTAYADELYTGIDKLDDWPEIIKTLQRNWIGKSEGSEIIFKINGEDWKIFTTRADTLMGVTFLVVSAQHPKLMELVTKEQKKDVDKLLKKLHSVKEEDMDKMEKEGAFTGAYAIHPLTKEKIPVYAGNFVLADYGAGMVMAVPAHDQRDYEFAKKYNIPIKEVVVPNRIDKKNPPVKGKVSKERQNVQAIVYNPKTKKYLFLKSHEFNWITLPMGGVDEGESIIESAKREVKEEAGYVNLKFIKVLGGKIRAEYFATHKNENRVSFTNAVMFELIDEKKVDILEEEKGKHEILWLDKSKIVYPYIVHAELNDWLERWDKDDGAYTDYGVLINSGDFNGLTSEEAKEHITIALKEKKLGDKKINFKLRDWLISRQRFWGTPIPIIYCDKCGTVPVPEKELPVILPENVKFEEVKNPLVDYKPFVEVKCYKCGGKAKRETDTMDTFVNSSWYYLRYTDPKNSKKIFDEKKANYWNPIDMYIGGKEHACLHLIYIRFYTKFLRDLGLLKFDEPAKRMFNQGFLLGPDGEKMSKSKGNVILPDGVSEKYGMDTARLFLAALASPDKEIEWSENGIEGTLRLMKRIFNFTENIKFGKTPKIVESKLNKTIQKVTEDIEYLKYNFAVIKLRELFDSFDKGVSKEDYEKFIKMFSVFCPHVSDELWEKIGNKGFVYSTEWPKADESKIDEKMEQVEKNIEKTVSDVINVMKIVKEKSGKDANKIYLYVLPNELEFYDSKELSIRVAKEVKVYAVNSKDKYDPEGKASKAKPGKPGIYIE